LYFWVLTLGSLEEFRKPFRGINSGRNGLVVLVLVPIVFEIQIGKLMQIAAFISVRSKQSIKLILALTTRRISRIKGVELGSTDSV
jgi:hypothetical protein